jgi:hypothetical protein
MHVIAQKEWQEAGGVCDLHVHTPMLRSNAKWAESQGPSWLPPTPWDTRAALTTLGHTEVDTAVAQAVAALKAGEVGLQGKQLHLELTSMYMVRYPL